MKAIRYAFFIVCFAAAGAAVTPGGRAEQIFFPAITHVTPEKDARGVSTTASVSVHFSSDMDKKSVESNFQIYPQMPGDFRWNKNELIFEPEEPLLPSATYFISFASGVKDTRGLPLAVTYFTTTAQALCVSPAGEIQVVSREGGVNYPLAAGTEPIWMSDNSSVIYVSAGQIWKTGRDGKNTAPLTDSSASTASRPVCAPQKNLITFIGTNAAGAANIYSLEAETKIVTQLTAFFEQKPIPEMRWSPDGLYIAFLRGGHLWLVDQNGSDLRRLTTEETTCKSNFAWSPGGTKIAFGGEKNVWIADIYSMELRKITFDNPQTGRLDWSEENKIVYEAGGIRIMEADGSREVKILTAGRFPRWVGTGKYLSFVLPLYHADDTAQLWIMSEDGTRKEKIADIDGRYPEISWSRHLPF